MNIEFEAKFLNINKEEMRGVLRQNGAKLVRPEYEQTRINFHLPKEKRSNDAWLRVRAVDDFDHAIQLLELIGCERKALQKTRRELWRLDNVDISIDEWPGLDPFIEIEGVSEEQVKIASKKLGLDYSMAVFGAVGGLYKKRYGISLDEIELKVGNIDWDNERLVAFTRGAI